MAEEPAASRSHRSQPDPSSSESVYRCTACGFAGDIRKAEEAAPAIVAGAADLAGTLRGEDQADLTRRPDPAVWSPLEYGCHVRDVLLVQRERVLAARRTDRPSFDPMGRDERAVHDGYADQHPESVARQLQDAADLLANVLARLGPSDWERRVIYNYPERWERPLRWVAVHTAHEVHHHLTDIRQQLGPEPPASEHRGRDWR